MPVISSMAKMGIAAIAAGVVLYMYEKERQRLEQQLQLAIEKREVERRGRVKAEQAMRKSIKAKRERDGHVFSTIGTIRSCYPTRNGCPRQPQLVPNGRAVLKLASKIPSASLESLETFSHCWILFVFDENTNAHHSLQNRTTFKAKVKPPQLDGKKVGLFSTRTPHRPNPIGLSVAKIARVDCNNREIYFCGIDIVHGTSVLDIKPYVPFDIVLKTMLTVPSWVDNNDIFRPLKVIFDNEEDRERLITYVKNGNSELYGKADYNDFLECIEQMLSLDIRSKNQGRGDRSASREYSCNFDSKRVELRFVTKEDGVHIVQTLTS